MFYRFMQAFLRLVMRVYFRKIYFSGAMHLPLNKPVILACNHPNSFLDAVLLAVLIKEPIHFLARSDVFNTPFKQWLLQKFNLIPIYRLQEGSENLHRNEDTFDQCYRILKNNGRVLIFSEGICIQEKRLRPLKKGTARLAFGAVAATNFALDLQVIPVGINYTYPAKFRQEVMIGMAPPIAAKELEALYRDQPGRALLELNEKISAGLKENIIIIPEKRQEAPIEALLVQQRLQSKEFNSGHWLSYSNAWLQQERKLVQNYLSEEEGNSLSHSDLTVRQSPLPEELTPPQPLWNMPKGYLLLFGLGFPVFLAGFVANILPLWLARQITKNKVKHIEFYSSVLMVTGFVLYLLYLLLVALLGFSFSVLIGLTLILLLPALGYVTLLYRDAWLYWHKHKAFVNQNKIKAPVKSKEPISSL